MSTDQFKNSALYDHSDHWHPEAGLAAGIELLYAHPTYLAYRSIDNIIGMSARELGRFGLVGADGWITPNDGLPPAQTVGLLGAVPGLREVSRGRVDLTAGCYPRAYIDYLPPGPIGGTGTGEFFTTGSYGEVVISGTLYGSDGTSRDVYHKFICEQANNITQAESGSIYINQSSKHSFSPLMVPTWNFLSESAPYAENCIFEYTVYYDGSPRILNGYICEEPYLINFNRDYASGSSAASYSEDGLLPDQILNEYPVSEGDGDEEPRHGSIMALNAVRNQQDRLGPSFFNWSAHDESDNSNLLLTRPSGIVFDNTSDYESIIDMTPFNQLTSSSIGYLGHVSNNQRNKYNDQESCIFGKKAIMPVIVRALMDISGTNFFRIKSSDYTISEVQLNGDYGYTDGWVEFDAFIEGDIYPHAFVPNAGVQIGIRAFAGGAEVSEVNLYYLNMHSCKDYFSY